MIFLTWFFCPPLLSLSLSLLSMSLSLLFQVLYWFLRFLFCVTYLLWYILSLISRTYWFLSPSLSLPSLCLYVWTKFPTPNPWVLKTTDFLPVHRPSNQTTVLKFPQLLKFILINRPRCSSGRWVVTVHLTVVLRSMVNSQKSPLGLRSVSFFFLSKSLLQLLKLLRHKVVPTSFQTLGLKCRYIHHLYRNKGDTR